jgi:hypothetical protein
MPPAGGHLTREEARDMLLDAYRPLTTYMESFGDFSLAGDPGEATKRLRAALPLVRKAAEQAWTMHSIGVAHEPAGVDWIGHTDLMESDA